MVIPYRGFGKPIGPIFKDLDAWIWDRYAVPKSRYGITTTRCVTIHKSVDLICIAPKDWDHANPQLSWADIQQIHSYLEQIYTNPQLSWADIHKSRKPVGRTTFGTVARNTFGSSTRNLAHVNLLAPRILKWLLYFGKFVHPLSKINNVHSALWLWMADTFNSGKTKFI